MMHHTYVHSHRHVRQSIAEVFDLNTMARLFVNELTLANSMSMCQPLVLLNIT